MGRARARRLLGLGPIALGLLALCGCARGCTSSRPPIHLNPNMDYQEKAQPLEESRFFYDGSAMRKPVEGTVPRDGLIAAAGRLVVGVDPYRRDLAFHSGKDRAGQFLAALPLPEQDERLLARGAERYSIYCQPCHDKRGNGKGILFERGGVPTPSFHDERLRKMAPGEIFDTITQGKGLMPAYGYPIPAEDRWAIIAHLRRLQRERGAAVASLGQPPPAAGAAP